MTLHFQYGNRWRNLGGLFLPEGLDDDLVSLLEERDRQLEDYLESARGGGVIGQSSGISASGTQSISNGVATDVTFDTVDFDGLGTADVSNDWIVIPSDGVYLLTGICFWAAGTTGTRRALTVAASGAPGYASGVSQVLPGGSTTPITCNITVVTPLTAGDQVVAAVIQDSGGSLNIGPNTRLTVTRMSG